MQWTGMRDQRNALRLQLRMTSRQLEQLAHAHETALARIALLEQTLQSQQSLQPQPSERFTPSQAFIPSEPFTPSQPSAVSSLAVARTNGTQYYQSTVISVPVMHVPGVPVVGVPVPVPSVGLRDVCSVRASALTELVDHTPAQAYVVPSGVHQTADAPLANPTNHLPTDPTDTRVLQTLDRGTQQMHLLIDSGAGQAGQAGELDSNQLDTL